MSEDNDLILLCRTKPGVRDEATRTAARNVASSLCRNGPMFIHG